MNKKKFIKKKKIFKIKLKFILMKKLIDFN